MKKISFIIPSFQVGGTESSFIRMANSFNKSEFQSELVYWFEGGELRKLIEPGVIITSASRDKVSTNACSRPPDPTTQTFMPQTVNIARVLDLRIQIALVPPFGVLEMRCTQQPLSANLRVSLLPRDLFANQEILHRQALLGRASDEGAEDTRTSDRLLHRQHKP